MSRVEILGLCLLGLRWQYRPRPDLTHATIFRALKAEALVDALR